MTGESFPERPGTDEQFEKWLHPNPDQPCTCGGRRWVDDQNWQPEDHERDAARAPGAGLIPCGACNEGGWHIEPVQLDNDETRWTP